jgi:very-short-patch-repair endonuclease
MRRVHPADALAHLGGAAERKELLRLTSPKQLRTAVARGQVLRLARGRYGLAAAPQGRAAAARLSAVASHLTASVGHGWEVARPPRAPQLLVTRKRRLAPHQRVGVEIRHRDLEDHEVHGWLTSPHRTVIDCARDLPFPHALAVADSALRHGDVDAAELLKRARALQSTGRRQAIRVVEAATPLAANPLESVLRALALEVPGLAVQPQVLIEDRGFRGRPDLVDQERRIVIEADSFEFHGHRAALARDCVRYTGLAIRGWTVLRFSWEDVMLEPDYVRQVLLWAVQGPDGQAPCPESLLART